MICQHFMQIKCRSVRNDGMSYSVGVRFGLGSQGPVPVRIAVSFRLPAGVRIGRP